MHAYVDSNYVARGAVSYVIKCDDDWLFQDWMLLERPLFSTSSSLERLSQPSQLLVSAFLHYFCWYILIMHVHTCPMCNCGGCMVYILNPLPHSVHRVCCRDFTVQEYYLYHMGCWWPMPYCECTRISLLLMQVSMLRQ